MNAFTPSCFLAGFTRAALASILSGLLAGCVGSQQLLTANQQLSKTAGDAKTYAQKLKTAVDAEDTALANARTSVNALATAANQASRDKAVATINAAYYSAVDSLDAAYATVLSNWLDTTQTTFAGLNDSLKLALAPMEKARSDALSKYQNAKSLAAEYPNDATRRGAAQKLLDAYLDESAIVFQAEDQARAAATDAWSQIDKDFRQKLAAARDSKRKGLDTEHTDAITKIGAVPATPVNIGSDSDKIAPSVDTLINFTDASQKTATANVQYLTMYGFGKGSLFSDFFSSVGTGLVSGIPGVSTAKTTSWSDVVSAVEQVASTETTALKAASGDATSSLSQTGTTLIQQAANAFNAAVQSLISKIPGGSAPASAPAASSAQPASSS